MTEEVKNVVTTKKFVEESKEKKPKAYTLQADFSSVDATAIG